MDRRVFLRRFTTGLVATAALAHIPASVIQNIGFTDAAQFWATKKLTKAYNDFSRGTGSAHTPRHIFVGQELFTAFEGECAPLQRWVDPESASLGYKVLAFKCCRLSVRGTGYDIKEII